MAEPAMAEPAGSRLSARTRIVGWLMLTSVIGLAALVVTVGSALQAQVGREANDAVTQELAEFDQFVREGRDPETARQFASTDRLFEVFLRRQRVQDGEQLFGVSTDSGRIIQSGPTHAIAPADYDLTRDTRSWATIMGGHSGVIDTAAGEVRWGRYQLTASDGSRGSFVVAVFTEPQAAAASRTTQLLVLVGLGSLVLTALISWLAARAILQPIRTMRRTAEEITEHDLTRRLPVHSRDDIAELAQTFNALLDRLEAAFIIEQRFVDDAGHELRTPITIIRGHLELLSDSPEERDATIQLVTQELDRMSRIVGDLLALAKSERPDFILPVPGVDLAELTIDLDAKVQALGHRRWTLTEIAEGTCTLDPQRITQAVLQLAENAVHHTAEGSVIQLASRIVPGTNGDEVQFLVTDQGPGVRPEDASVIFERFAHGSAGQSRTRPGAGLGLAIVRAIADGHHGSAFVQSRPGAGSTFGIAVPAVDLVRFDVERPSAPPRERDTPAVECASEAPSEGLDRVLLGETTRRAER